MITPERRLTVVTVVPGVARAVRVPAAGHLGVIEERCTDALHEKATEGGRPCPTCRAAV